MLRATYDPVLHDGIAIGAVELVVELALVAFSVHQFRAPRAAIHAGSADVPVGRIANDGTRTQDPTTQ